MSHSAKIILNMSLTHAQALDLYRSDDLIGVGMEADALRRKLHPEGVVTYIIDRNINYTNVCNVVCTFCAFYRRPGAPDTYVRTFDEICAKIDKYLPTMPLTRDHLLVIFYHETAFADIRQGGNLSIAVPGAASSLVMLPTPVLVLRVAPLVAPDNSTLKVSLASTLVSPLTGESVFAARMASASEQFAPT